MSDDNRFIPECPRCGYDQSGAVAAWRDACPLTGTCPECGLAMQWGDIFSGRYRFPRWSYEHAQRGLASAWAFPRTVGRCFTPWRLWRDLKMHHRVAWVRLAIIGVVGAVCVAALSLLLLGAMDAIRTPTYGNWKRAIDNVFEPFADPSDALPPMGDHVGAVGRRITDRWMLVTAWMLITAPLGVVGLRQTMRSARIRAGNLLRIWGYALMPLPVVLAACTLARDGVRTLGDIVDPNGTARGLRGWLGDVLFEFDEWMSSHLEWRSVAVVTAAYLLAWMWFAYRRYLQLPHAAGIALASVGLAMLTGVAIVALLPGGLRGLM